MRYPVSLKSVVHIESLSLTASMSKSRIGSSMSSKMLTVKSPRLVYISTDLHFLSFNVVDPICLGDFFIANEHMLTRDLGFHLSRFSFEVIT